MSVKLYKDNMTGEIVAAAFNESYQKYYRLNKHCEVYSFDKSHFEYAYSPISEAPESWQLYETTKPIVECLPHEFVQEQPVLARKRKYNKWVKCEFDGYLNPEKFNGYGMKNWGGVWRYCLPYVGNEHLENTITEGEHGAVPRGYIPPHIPKLDDDDYWCVGDEVIDLSTGGTSEILEIAYNDMITLRNTDEYYKDGMIFTISTEPSLRVLYHKGSYVRSDGTVHEHIPTRPHRIEG